MRSSSAGLGRPVKVTTPWSLEEPTATTELTTAEEAMLLLPMMKTPLGVASSVARTPTAGRPLGSTREMRTELLSSASAMGPKLALPLLMGMLPAAEGTVAVARSVAEPCLLTVSSTCAPAGTSLKAKLPL